MWASPRDGERWPALACAAYGNRFAGLESAVGPLDEGGESVSNSRNRPGHDDVVTDQESAEAVLRAAAESATAAAQAATHTAGRLNAVLAAGTAGLEAALEAFPTRGYAAFSNVASLGEAIHAAHAAHTLAQRSYMSAMRVYLLSGETLLRVVRAVGTVVQAPDTTVADLRALAVVLQTTFREVERQRQAAVSAEPPGLALASYRWTVVGSLAGLVGVLIALLALVQDRIEADRPDPPPSVTVVVPQPGPAEFDHRVDERLREREQDQADHGRSTGANVERDHGPGQ